MFGSPVFSTTGDVSKPIEFWVSVSNLGAASSISVSGPWLLAPHTLVLYHRLEPCWHLGERGRVRGGSSLWYQAAGSNSLGSPSSPASLTYITDFESFPSVPFPALTYSNLFLSPSLLVAGYNHRLHMPSNRRCVCVRERERGEECSQSLMWQLSLIRKWQWLQPSKGMLEWQPSKNSFCHAFIYSFIYSLNFVISRVYHAHKMSWTGPALWEFAD